MTMILAADDIPAWVAPLIGTAFADRRQQAAGRDGVDCWQLAGLAYAACGQTLPDVADYRDGADAAAIAAALRAALPDWDRIGWGDEAALDLASCRRPYLTEGGWRCYPLHVAVVIRPGVILDIDRRNGAHLAGYGERRRLGIEAFWRLR